MSSYVIRQTPGDTSWFIADRFGMFIHFGLYSLTARHEWVKRYENIPDQQYDRYLDYFNPDLYNPREWAQKAKAAGMKYAVLTTKHHEGFCLFDSQYTDYKVTNTPYGKDIVKEFVDAFREEGIRVGFYYSLLDWHHPEYPISWYHPRCSDADAEELNRGRDIKKYADYMRKQLKELMTNYGQIDILWFDFSYPDMIDFNDRGWGVAPNDWMKPKGKEAWESEKLIALVRSLQPQIVINNRADIDQDFWTPEQRMPSEWVSHPNTGELVPWEGCQTFSGSWGYNRDEMTWKKPKMLIDLLISSVSSGGNLIMNVGPTGRGCFDSRTDKALQVFVDWMKYNSRSIYNCTMAAPEFQAPSGCRYTQSQDGKRLYVHLKEYPLAYLPLPGLAGKVQYAQFLHDASELFFTEKQQLQAGDVVKGEENMLMLQIPALQPDILVPVVELFLK